MIFNIFLTVYGIFVSIFFSIKIGCIPESETTAQTGGMILKKRLNTLLLRLYLPFLVFIVIPMLLLNIAIFQLLDNIKENEYKENLSRLASTGNYLAKDLEESIQISRRFLFHTQLLSLTQMEKEKTNADYARIRETDAAFQEYFSVPDQHCSLSIFYPGSDIFLSTDGTCSDFSYYYGKSYQFGNYSLEDIYDMAEHAGYHLEFHPEIPFVINSSSYKGLFFTLGLNWSANSLSQKALMITVLNRDSWNETLHLLNEEDGFSYITSADGQVLFTEGTPLCEIQPFLPQSSLGYLPEEIYGKHYRASYFLLPEGLFLYNIKPSSILVRQTSMLTALVFALNLVCVGICLGIATWIVIRKKEKLHSIFSFLGLSGAEKKFDYYAQINQGISSLLGTNQTLSTNLAQNTILLRHEFWNKLYCNGFPNADEIKKAAISSDLHLNADSYCLVVLSLRRNSSSSIANEETYLDNDTVVNYREQLLEIIETKITAFGYAHNMPAKQTVLFLRITKENQERYQSFTEELLSGLPLPPAGFFIVCAGSRLFEDMTSSADEYNYCCNVLLRYYDTLDTPSKEHMSFLWSLDKYEQRTSLYFPQSLSEHLAFAIRSGEIEKVNACFHEILTENFQSDHPITQTMSSMLINQLKLVLLSVYQEEMRFNLEDWLKHTDALLSDAVKLSDFIKLANQMCEYYQKNLEQKTEKLRQKIVQYIQEQYTSPTFSLTEVASHCGFSDSYFSMLFRDIMQVNFSVYVEQLKMAEADRLLTQTTLKIDEIAFRLGYSNADTFRRAYKKYYGSSPSKRRSM